MYRYKLITKRELVQLCNERVFYEMSPDEEQSQTLAESIRLYEHNGEPIAVLIIYLTIEGEYEILGFEVTPKLIGKGVGKSIILDFLQEVGEAIVISIPESAYFWVNKDFNPMYSKQVYNFIKEDLRKENDSPYLLQVTIKGTN